MTRAGRTGLALGALLLLGAAAAPSVARAQTLRLRGDALATTPSPVGLVVLEGEDRTRPWLTAEASIWWGGLGEDHDGTEVDALSMSVRLRDPGGRGTLRLGRQVLVVGALHPVHADGAHGLARLPMGFTVESFAGLPVEPGTGPRASDWILGGRVGKALGPARLGVGWAQRREAGAVDDHELAADLAVVPDGPWDLGAAVAYDLAVVGLSELRLSTAWRRRAWRAEVFALHRSPSRLLPATSLFSVLGDVPSQRAGVTVRWRAAPRLDVWGSAGARRLDDDVGADASARAVLRLDDSGGGRVGLELRRDGGPDGGWTGVRATAHAPLAARWALAGEAELVVPDAGSDTRGEVWPWGLAAVTWRPAPRWEAACAVEASASPTYHSRVDVLARVTRAWELQP